MTTSPPRLWIGFDGLTWTAKDGLVRWCVRTPDTAGKHNDPKFARDGVTYTGADKNAGLVAASKLGGPASIRAVTDAGVKVTEVPESELPEAVRNDKSEKGLAFAAALSFQCQIVLDEGPDDEEQKSRVVQGGDRTAGHATFGLASCIHKDVVCFRCLLPKHGGAWTKKDECDVAGPRASATGRATSS